MPDLIELVVVTPERELVRAQVESVQVPGKDGAMGILPGHAPLVGRLGTGFLAYAAAGRRHHLAISGGFIEVVPGQVRVLADQAERAEDIDIEKARAELKQAQEALAHQTAETDPVEILATEQRAQARVDAAEQK
ncbi:MAG: ATP synthase F1 subunit epsilon [Bryobacteraceae bacterium]|jgi:F-type H+-transporting ATPase subunit epsilon